MSTTPTPHPWAEGMASYFAIARANRPDWAAFHADVAADLFDFHAEVADHFFDLDNPIGDDDFDAFSDYADEWLADNKAPTVEQYAEILVGLIRADLTGDPERFGKARSFADLSDVCDENEYLIEADAKTGNPEPFGGDTVDDDALTAWGTFTSAAIALAERDLGWTPDAPPVVVQVPLFDMVAEIFPNAEPLWQGAPNTDSAIVPFLSHVFVVTREDDAYLVGFYRAEQWQDAEEPVAFVEITEPENVVSALDAVTEPAPDGREWEPWVVDTLTALADPPTVDLTPRQLRLVFEVLTMVDVDTLNDNLAAEGLAETTGEELDAIAAHFKGRP